jgi:arylamine N-acetyltransferase
MPQDFIYVNYYLATHPDSIFRKKLMVNLPAHDGRRSIYFEDGAYVFRVDGMEEEYIQPDNMARLKDVLAQSFNIIW